MYVCMYDIHTLSHSMERGGRRRRRRRSMHVMYVCMYVCMHACRVVCRHRYVIKLLGKSRILGTRHFGFAGMYLPIYIPTTYIQTYIHKTDGG